MSIELDPELDKWLSPEEFPELNKSANQIVRIEFSSSTGPSANDNGYATLTIIEARSSEVLVEVEFDPARLWRLLQGGQQTWPAFVSPDLDRVGKRMENRAVEVPERLPGDTERDLGRDVFDAVGSQLPVDWGNYQAYDRPRTTNANKTFVTVRRWV